MRIIYWYDHDDNLVLRHLIPRGKQKVPYTNYGPNQVTYCDFNGSAEIPHAFVPETGPGRGRPKMLMPTYYFANEQQSVRFQCAARQKQLLRTFDKVYVRTNKDNPISSREQLKLWQKMDDSNVTFTFFAYMNVDPKHHYEFDLLWFREEIKRSGKELTLTFNTFKDERKKSVDKGKSLFKSNRRSSHDNNSPEHRNRRSSSHSRSPSDSSSSQVIPGTDRIVTRSKVYLGWKCLHIEFDSEKDAEEFMTLCHNPEGSAGSRLVPEPIWRISQLPEGFLHRLYPVLEMYTSRRIITLPTVANDIAVSNASRNNAHGWMNRLHELRGWLQFDDSQTVPIAVLDTGIDNTNPWIHQRWGKYSQSKERYRNFLDDDVAAATRVGTGPYSKRRADEIVRSLGDRQRDTPQDDTGHGTHVAGIILQLYPEATLFVGRVLENDVTTNRDETRTAAKRLALAIIYATVVWKVKIISLSIGIRKENLSDEEKAMVRNAIRFATNVIRYPGDNGVLIFAAASNEGNRDRILFPAAEPEPFCIHSSNGYGVPSEFNSPCERQRQSFSILGEGVRSTWLQRANQGEAGPSWAIRRGTSVATPIAASAVAIIIHFSRQHEPKGNDDLETREGIRIILSGMADENRQGFYDIVPWHGVFQLSTNERSDDPIEAASRNITRLLDEEH
ncbi:subtilisin-like protein [Polyplosphaeria fusca]|uniref:Subtilisin-like protein n=1 Tax=Polyplosphaeria fusca TaxID=682080 RepID=A0A9P4QKB1_9PLEO|nr:subtilisin-like protein [Polyplosphaeria fusca]